MRFFLKELIGTKLYLPNGASVPFEDVGGNYGLLQTADPNLIGELDKAVKTHIGGVIALTEAEYSEWVAKKKASQLSSPSQPRGREALGPIPFQQLEQLRAAGAAGVLAGGVGNPVIGSPNAAAQQAQQQKVEPITVPQQFTKPKVGKIAPPAPTP